MAIKLNKTIFNFALPEKFKNVPVQNRILVKEEIAQAVLREIKSYTESSISPVAGYGAYKGLSKKYKAKKQKMGKGGNADLHLNDEMINSIQAITNRGSKIVFKIEGVNAKKSHNHNLGVTLPQRPFMPNEGETFKRSILSLVNQIISESTPNKDGSFE